MAETQITETNEGLRCAICDPHFETIFANQESLREHVALHALVGTKAKIARNSSTCKICCALCDFNSSVHFDTTLADALRHLDQHTKIPELMLNVDRMFGNSLVCFVSQSEMMCCACKTRGFFSVGALMQHFTETHMQTPPKLSIQFPECTFCGRTYLVAQPGARHPPTKKEQAVSRTRHLENCQHRWTEVDNDLKQHSAKKARIGLVLAHALAMQYPTVNAGSLLQLVDEHILRTIAGMM